MSDLTRALIEVAERGTPIGSARLRERVMLDLVADASASRRRRFNVSRPPWAFAGAAVAMLLLLGAVPLLLRTSSDGAEPPAVTTVSTTVSTPSTTPPATTGAPEISTSAAVSTTTTLAPVAVPMEWSRVELGAAAAEGDITTVIAGEQGFFAGGFANFAGERVAALWTSPDGSSWTRLAHDAAAFGGAPATGISGLATGDAGYVAVGSSGRDGVVWTSIDGDTWERAPESVSFTGDGWIKMLAVTYGPGGYVAVGYESQPDSDAMIDRGVVWLSPDGLVWERIDSELFTTAMLEDVTVTESGYVAVGLDWTPAPIHAGVWVSPDGRNWSQVDVASDNGGDSMAAVVAADGLMVAVGNYSPGLAIPEREGDGCMAMWLSDDSATWTRVPNDAEQFCGGHGVYAYAVAGSTGRIVAVGERRPKSVAASQAAAWVSNDAGSTWHHIATPAETFGVDANSEVSMGDVAAIDGVFVAVGVYDNETAIWTGIWNEENGP